MMVKHKNMTVREGQRTREKDKKVRKS